MKVAVFSTLPFEKPILHAALEHAGHQPRYIEASLNADTALLADGCPAACLFANDNGSRPALEALAGQGVRYLALRSAGFNHVDLEAAERLGMTVARVPAYSPYAVAEHTLALILTLNRKIHRAYNRVREGNFDLTGLLGFDMHGKTVGVVGTGRIGAVLTRILRGMGCRILAVDPEPSEELRALGVRYVSLDDMLPEAHIITLNCPLNPKTRHLLNEDTLARTRPGVMIINTSRGAVVDAQALIGALKSGHVGAVGLDVYEQEADLFFHDLSNEVIQDDVLARLLTFPNVVITAHQGFFTREAVDAIASTTARNLTGFEKGDVPQDNIVRAASVTAGR